MLCDDYAETRVCFIILKEEYIKKTCRVCKRYSGCWGYNNKEQIRIGVAKINPYGDLNGEEVFFTDVLADPGLNHLL